MTRDILTEVHDTLTIQKLKAEYITAADALVDPASGAAEKLTRLFMAEAKGDYLNAPLNGRDAIVGFLADAIAANNDWLWHSISSPRIDVRDDTATGDWTIMVKLKATGSSVINTLIGRYSDEFRRTAEGWLISSIRFTQEAHEHSSE